MPDYVFLCDVTHERMIIEMDREEVPSIGEWSVCICDEPEVHDMRRVVQPVKFAQVPGTPTNKIGMALEDRAELGRRRRAEMERNQRKALRDG